MRRRRSLVLLAVLLMLVTAMTIRRLSPGANVVRPDPSASATRDTSALTDSAAAADSQLVDDPPCLASRVGLPCR